MKNVAQSFFGVSNKKSLYVLKIAIGKRIELTVGIRISNI